jgi:undecaprenyl diphosphate synthase
MSPEKDRHPAWYTAWHHRGRKLFLRGNFAVQSDEQGGLHVAIIMDGNGRWATRRGLPRAAGHRAGVAAVRRVVEHAPDLGIRWLTLYAFSSDNWSRPADEVESIFWLLRAYLRLETERLRRSGARLQVIGRRDRLPNRLLREIAQAEKATAQGHRLHLRVAVDYSSRDAITRAAAGVTAALSRERPFSADLLAGMLATALAAESGEVDLLIRTGGEKRLSDFLLWESAYAELLFTDRMWPDFEASDLEAAMGEFSRRERRFGAVPAAPARAAASGRGGAR